MLIYCSNPVVNHQESFSLSGTEMGDNILSHLPDVVCKSVRSKKKMLEQCSNPATHGQFCGIHYKNPILWEPSKAKTLTKKRIKSFEHSCLDAKKIQAWYRFHRGLFMVRRRGLGYWTRSILTNDADFFSTDPVQDISGQMFLSYKDEQNHVYGFDIRSLNALYIRAEQMQEKPQNPFTRKDFPEWLLNKKNTIIERLLKRGIPQEWVPIQPPTPEQQWRMKVVDLFNKIDELNYYSSPDWFIGLNLYGQVKFYRELFDIWNFRAGLSPAQKNAIVPQYPQKIFKHSPNTVSQQTIQVVQKLNMNTMRLLISSAEDRNDRILGAMYIITTFTLVNRQARIAYPWLYDSVAFQEPHEAYEQQVVHPFETLFGINWLQNFILDPMPPLTLEPNANNHESH